MEVMKKLFEMSIKGGGCYYYIDIGMCQFSKNEVKQNKL